MGNSNSSKYQMYVSKRANYHKELALTKELTKAIYSIKLDDNIWTVKWKDFSFSVKPFLCSAMSFISNSDLFITLCQCIISSDSEFYDKLGEYKKSEYLSIFNDDENNISESIYYQFNSRIPCLTRYLIGLDDISVIRKFMSFLIKEFLNIWHDCDYYINFADSDICNTEAFSYFISMLWVFQKSKKVQMLLLKEFKTLDILSILDGVCPETSLHYKYLSGEISSSDLKIQYKSLDIVHKELYNLMTRGKEKYNKDIHGDCIEEAYRSIMMYYEYEDFVFEMYTQYIVSGLYDLEADKRKKYKKQASEYKYNNTELIKENKDLKSKVKSLSKEKDKVINKCKKLIDSNDVSKYEIRIKKLTSFISDLKAQISQLKNSIIEKDKEILNQKQLIRSQIKEIKSLKARLDELEPLEEEIKEVVVDTEPEISIEEMAERLKDFKLGVFGGFDAGNLTEKFKGYGLEVKHIIDEKQFVVGDLDCAIVLTTNIQHKTVRRLKSQYDGNFVYISGTSIESMIQEAYNLLCKENLTDED